MKIHKESCHNCKHCEYHEESTEENVYDGRPLRCICNSNVNSEWDVKSMNRFPFITKQKCFNRGDSVLKKKL